MFSKLLFFVFLTLSVTTQASAQALPNNRKQEQCSVISTVVRTVTVTARSAPTGNAGNNGNNGNTPPRGGNNNNNANATRTTTTARAAATNKGNNNAGNNNGGNNNNNATATRTTTTARATAANKGNNNAGNNNGGNNNNATTRTTTSASAAATNKGNNNGGNNNASTTRTTTSARATATNNGNNNAGNNNGGNNANNGNANNGGNNANPQTSLTLDPRVIAPGFANDGQDVPAAGQVPSLTSKNNFINFCLTVPNLPLTNGKQITTGSCNPVPIGAIPTVDRMPSSKFVFPKNFATIKAGETFTIEMAIKNMQAGFFVNAQANYFAAPQQLNGQGLIQGHSHVVVEKLTSLDQTTPLNPKEFAFFKGLNAAAVGGKLSAVVTGGLTAGVYKLSSINTAANHQPAIVPVAQHGSLDDAVYFTVTNNGQPAAGNNAGNGNNVVGTKPGANPAVSTSAASASSTSSAKPASTARGSTTSAPATRRPASTSVSSSAAATTTPARGNNNNQAGNNNQTGNNGTKGNQANAGNNNGNNKPAKASSSSSSKPAATPTPAVQGGRRQRRYLNRQA